MNVKNLKLHCRIALALWGLTVCSLVTAVAADAIPVEVVGKAADLAREKNIVWLCVVLAILSLLFSAWLVQKMFALQLASVQALNTLREELVQRPCFLPENHHNPHR